MSLVAEDTDGDGILDHVTKGICEQGISPSGINPRQGDNFHAPCEGGSRLGYFYEYELFPLWLRLQRLTRVPGLVQGCEGPLKQLKTSQQISWEDHSRVSVNEYWEADVNGDDQPDFGGPTSSKVFPVVGGFANPYERYPDMCRNPQRRAYGQVTFWDRDRDRFFECIDTWEDPDHVTITSQIDHILPTFVPHFGNGSASGVTVISEVTVDNPGNEEVFGEIKILASNGAAMPVAIEGMGTVSTVPFQVAAGGKFTFRTTGQGDLSVGSLRIHPSGPIGVVERFNLSGVGIAAVGGREPAAAVILPVRRQGGLSTGVAYTNAIKEAITLTFILKDATGVEVARTSRNVGPQGHGSLFFHELFSAVDTSSFEGTLTLQTNFGTFVAESLELDAGARIFTAAPVTPLVP